MPSSTTTTKKQKKNGKLVLVANARNDFSPRGDGVKSASLQNNSELSLSEMLRRRSGTSHTHHTPLQVQSFFIHIKKKENAKMKTNR